MPLKIERSKVQTWLSAMRGPSGCMRQHWSQVKPLALSSERKHFQLANQPNWDKWCHLALCLNLMESNSFFIRIYSLSVWYLLWWRKKSFSQGMGLNEDTRYPKNWKFCWQILTISYRWQPFRIKNSAETSKNDIIWTTTAKCVAYFGKKNRKSKLRK